MPVCAVNAARTARNVPQQIFARNVNQGSGNSSLFRLTHITEFPVVPSLSLKFFKTLKCTLNLNHTELHHGPVSLACCITVGLSLVKVREPHRKLTRKEHAGQILRSWRKHMQSSI